MQFCGIVVSALEGRKTDIKGSRIDRESERERERERDENESRRRVSHEERK